MKKETIIAVTFGILMGVIVGVIILSRTTKTDKKPIGNANLDLKTPSKVNRVVDASVLFEISDPETDITIKGNSYKIKGKVTKGSLVVMQSPAGNKVFKAEKEDFSQDFPVALGENIINITIYPSGKATDYQEKILRIYSLPE